MGLGLILQRNRTEFVMSEPAFDNSNKTSYCPSHVLAKHPNKITPQSGF